MHRVAPKLPSLNCNLWEEPIQALLRFRMDATELAGSLSGGPAR